MGLRKEQNTLTTMLSNLNNVVSSAESFEQDEWSEDDAVEVVVTNQGRRRRREKRRTRQNVAQLSSGTFFSAGQMQILFGELST